MKEYLFLSNKVIVAELSIEDTKIKDTTFVLKMMMLPEIQISRQLYNYTIHE